MVTIPMSVFMYGVVVSGPEYFARQDYPRAELIPYYPALMLLILAPFIVYFFYFPPWQRDLVLTPENLIISYRGKDLYTIRWKDIESVGFEGVWDALVLRGEGIKKSHTGLAKIHRSDSIHVHLHGCSVEPNQLERVIRVLQRSSEARHFVTSRHGIDWIRSGPKWNEITCHPVKERSEVDFC